MFVPRKWQKDCLERCKQRFAEGHKDFVLEASMGAGKSPMAAYIAQTLIDEYQIDHVLVVVPWRSIQGDAEKGMLGAFGSMLGLDARDRFFVYRRQAHQPVPDMDATVTLYQEVCNNDAVETLRLWKAKGLRFALICDEIHHTNEINGSWGPIIEQMADLAEYSIFMSGTYFRGDRKPISCIDLDDNAVPIKHFSYTYPMGVRDNVVRSVTTRHINARLTLYDKANDQHYELNLDEIPPKDIGAAKKAVLEPDGECIRQIIEHVHESTMRSRQKFSDAACLFVCRPGGSDNYTTATGESIEDKHVHIIAKQIRDITGVTPTVVTHKDKDAVGKIARFRRASDPYLVAVNMVSEGCDIPRLRSIAFCRYTTSEMLFRQIVGRALRLHNPEDGTAAQVFIPAFPRLIEYGTRLYTEAQEGVRDRRCQVCGGWPCTCPCPVCEAYPCECEIEAPPYEPSVFTLDAVPVPDGGNVGLDNVGEGFVQAAMDIMKQNVALIHQNQVQVGLLLQQFQRRTQGQGVRPNAVIDNPVAERERIGRKINRHVRRLAYHLYNKDYAEAFVREVQTPFKEKFTVIMQTWSIDRIREVEDHIERRIIEGLRNGRL